MLIVVRVDCRDAAVVKIKIVVLVAARADAGETGGVACVFGGGAASALN